MPSRILWITFLAVRKRKSLIKQSPLSFCKSYKYIDKEDGIP